MHVQELIWPVIRVGVAVYVGLALLLFFLQSRYVYYPSRPLELTPAALKLTYEDVNVTTADGVAVHGWYVPGGDSGRTILFCHGNAGNIGDRSDVIRMFHKMGYNVCIFDYRGYGKSGGAPTEGGTYLDAEAVWKWLEEVKGIAQDKIVVHGESLGGAVAAWLAEHKKPAALILESTFTSLPDMAAKVYPFLPARWLCRFRYNTLDRLQDIRCPVFVAHGQNDEMIPFLLGRQLFQAANEPKVFFELSGSHNDGREQSGRGYEEALKAFIEKAVPVGSDIRSP